MIDRYLAFEEPVSRWAKLRKAVTRLGARAGEAGRVDTSNSSQFEQDLAFAATFGALGDVPQECLLVTVMLALEELRRYDSLLFDGWLASIGGCGWTQKGTDTRTAESRHATEQLLASAAHSFKLAPSKIEWLRHCLLSSPDWQTLLSPGPWDDDPRCSFLVELMAKIKEEFDETVFDTTSSWQNLRELFESQLKVQRKRLPGAFLPRLLLLVEGQTEAVLVPAFGRCLKFDLDMNGVYLQSSGGAKQVLKRFLQLHHTCALPIVCVLDADAVEQAELLKENLRNKDRLVHLEAGEIEDAFSAKRLVFSLNQYARASGLEQGITTSDLSDNRKTNSLDRLWRRRGQSSFDKIGFAHVLADAMRDENDVPEDGKKIVVAMQEVLQEGLHD